MARNLRHTPAKDLERELKTLKTKLRPANRSRYRVGDRYCLRRKIRKLERAVESEGRMPDDGALTIRIDHHGEAFRVAYRSLEECLRDRDLANLLDYEGATCSVWCGDLKLTGRPVQSSAALRDVLVERAKAIVGRMVKSWTSE